MTERMTETDESLDTFIIEGIEDALLITAMSGYLQCNPHTLYTEEDIGRFQAACIRQLERVGVVPDAGPEAIREEEEGTDE